MAEQHLLMLGRHFKVIELMASGGFGSIYRAVDCRFGFEVAVKTSSSKNSFLIHEHTLYERLFRDTQIFSVNIPNYYCFFKNKMQVCFVLELLGPSLQTHLRRNHFSLKTTLIVADQMLRTLSFLHSHNFVHQDIKPDNMCAGLGNNRQHKIYLVDFGLAQKFVDDKNEHVVMNKHAGFVGTTRFASLNAHKGYALSRRDDLESLGYTLVYMLKGLPWTGLKGKDKKAKRKKVMQMKAEISIDELCSGLPVAFEHYFRYVTRLSFKERPNYGKLRSYFKDVIKQLQDDHQFEWFIDSEQPTQSDTSTPNKQT